MAEEKKTAGAENQKTEAKKPKVGDQGIRTKRITAEEIRAKARRMQELSDDQDIVKKLEQTAAKFSEVDVNELLKGIQEIVDSDNKDTENGKDAGSGKSEKN